MKGTFSVSYRYRSYLKVKCFTLRSLEITFKIYCFWLVQSLVVDPKKCKFFALIVEYGTARVPIATSLLPHFQCQLRRQMRISNLGCTFEVDAAVYLR